MDFRDRLYRLRPVELEHLGPDGQRLHANGRRYFECVSLAPPRARRARALSAREGERRLDISQTDAVCVEDIPPNRRGRPPPPAPPRRAPEAMARASPHAAWQLPPCEAISGGPKRRVCCVRSGSDVRLATPLSMEDFT